MVHTQHERELITYDIFADSLFTIKMNMNNLTKKFGFVPT